ncbi:unnamed protein product [Pieris brassicae]|uniref:protein-histidine N-methyltransferase n=1 Tax=Pieris brassicae TaxID=7116 RepID=A0A9P0X987_PIEBR|nr:unnamed protein product [Pieris brassicae]
MNSFKFNFNGTNEAVDVKENTEIEWLQCERVELTNQHNNLETIAKQAKMFMCGDVEIGHVFTNQLSIDIGQSKKNAVELAEKEHSDLITGKYEGGLKIWECTYDLIEFLENNDINLESKQTLDLGCGTGILGIYSYLKNATVTFQDYNKEVLENITIPNVLLNIEDENSRESEIQKCNFFCGDWKAFNDFLSNDEKYDVILTSETIYNLNNYDKLINLFEQRLSNNGVIYVAAKTYYFGVGGGTRQFEKVIENSATLTSEIVWKTTCGIQREIIKIYKI